MQGAWEDVQGFVLYRDALDSKLVGCPFLDSAIELFDNSLLGVRTGFCLKVIVSMQGVRVHTRLRTEVSAIPL